MAQVSEAERSQPCGDDAKKESGLDVVAGLFRPSRPKLRQRRDGQPERVSRKAHRRQQRERDE